MKIIIFAFLFLFLSCEKKIYTPNVKIKTTQDSINETLNEIKAFDNKKTENKNQATIINPNKIVSESNQEQLDKAMKLKFEGEYLKALDIFLNVLRTQEENETIIENIIDIYIKLKDDLNAIKYTEKLLDINAGNIFGLMTSANFYFKNKDLEKALDFYLRIIDKEPTNTNILFNIAVIYEQKNMLDKAVNYFEKVAALKEDADIYMSIAIIYDKLNKKNETIRYLLKSLKFDRNNTKTRKFLAETYIKSNEYEKSIEQYEYIIKSSDDVNDFKSLAACYQSLGNYENAAKTYEYGLKISPNDTDMLYFASIAFYNLKDKKKMAQYVDIYSKISTQITEKRKLKVLLDKL